MKITIPDNIKKWTERIAEEYKQVYEDICEARATNKKINEDLIIRVIQSLSKDIEHNKVFKSLLEAEV